MSSLKILQAALPDRARLFQTRLREEAPQSISVAFTNTLPDPCIGAEALDYMDANKHFLSIVWHYIVRTDGVVEIGRDPKRLTSRTSNHFANHYGLHIGIVGGLNEEGEREQTTTPAQSEALAQLEQALADALGKPLEVHDSRPKWCKVLAEQDPQHDPDLIEEAHDELDADLASHEAASTF